MTPNSAVVGNSKKKVITEVKVVPWYNAAQFRKVYEYLYSPDIVKKNWALDQIDVWQTRCYPSLPGAIGETSALATAFVRDAHWMNGHTLDRQQDIEMTYISAIFKFVNWFIDSHKDLVKQGATSAQIAKIIGIPSYIVDMRNEGCHSYAPSLACLRYAAEDAMEHLKTSYWELEAAQVKNHVKKAPDIKEAKQMISQFIKTKLQIMRDQEEMSTREDSQAELNLNKHLEDIDGLIEKNKDLFIKALVMDGHFIPHDEDLKFLAEETYQLFQQDYDANTEQNHSGASIWPSTIPDVPEMHEALWVPVINHLNLHSAVPLFMEALLRSQGDRTIAGQKLIIAWVLKILCIHTIYRYARGSPLRNIFKYRGIIVNWQSLFLSSLENPCVYTSFVFVLMLNHLNLSQQIVRRFMQLYTVRVGLTKTWENVNVEDRIFTVEDILKARELQNGESKKAKKSIWSLVTDDSYKNWPIGIVLNPDGDEKEKVKEEDLKTVEREFKIEYIIGNGNDTEEQYCDVKIEDSLPDEFLKDFMDELQKRETLLYK